jgi:hypothetical protein
VSFGSPRVGNRAFANFFNTQIDRHTRFVHGNDIITKVPRINYTHVGNERRIRSSSAAERNGCATKWVGSIRDHSMDEYVEALHENDETEKCGLLFNSVKV